MKKGNEVAVRAPARVNLIGEHTDYNGGFVLPAALSLGITLRGGGRGDRTVSVLAEDLGERGDFCLDSIERGGKYSWLEYIKGVCCHLGLEGYSLKGADFSVGGDIPRGAGLSSSAALEVACALFFQRISEFEMGPVETAKLCQRVENEFVGMRCGLMDQLACCLGRKGSALFIDCESLEYEHIRLDDGMKLVVCDTGVKRELAFSEYNRRRSECEEAAKLLGAGTLREIKADEFERCSAGLPEVLYRRARHVVTENERVLKTVSSLKSGRFGELRELFSFSHVSLRDDFEVSCPELDLMVELAREQEGVFGARMTGAGFGGCTVNLVEAGQAEKFKSSVYGKYLSETGIEPGIYVCEASDGAGPSPEMPPLPEKYC